MAVVARQELRDLWIGGRGLVLAVAFSVLLSAITYLGATNQALNFLERREAVNLTLQVAVGVGALLALAAIPDLGGVRPDAGRAGWLVLDGPDVDVPAATATLGAAGIPVLAFELEGARLSDAYLAMTGAG